MQDIPRDKQCPHCGRFSNRGLSVDAVIIRDQQVLLIKRGVDPFKGYWATPGGYVDWDETTEDAVTREVKEETGLTVSECTLLSVHSSPNRHPKQVINIVYIIKTEDTDAVKGDDADEVKWFSIEGLPHELAFDHRQNIDEAIKYLQNSSSSR